MNDVRKKKQNELQVVGCKSENVSLEGIFMTLTIMKIFPCHYFFSMHFIMMIIIIIICIDRFVGW